MEGRDDREREELFAEIQDTFHLFVEGGPGPLVDRTERGMDVAGIGRSVEVRVREAEGCGHMIRRLEDLGARCPNDGRLICARCAQTGCAWCGRPFCSLCQIRPHGWEEDGYLCADCARVWRRERRRNQLSGAVRGFFRGLGGVVKGFLEVTSSYTGYGHWRK